MCLVTSKLGVLPSGGRRWNYIDQDVTTRLDFKNIIMFKFDKDLND